MSVSRVMAVDDAQEILLLVKVMLEREGIEVIEAGNGEMCLMKLNEGGSSPICSSLML